MMHPIAMPVRPLTSAAAPAAAATPLADLAAAAREHLFTPGGPTRVLVPAGGHRRAAAAIMDAVAMGLVALGGTIVTMVGYMLVTGDDFDGPPLAEELGNWFGATCIGGWAVVYTLVEVVASSSLGKALLGLRIEPADHDDSRPRRRRLAVRWAVKAAPLLLVTTLSAAGYVYLWAGRDYLLERSMAVITALECAIAGVLVIAVVVHVAAGVALREMLHDRVAGTGVFRRQAAPVVRGFEPIMARR